MLCLALNIYHEARGEPVAGQVAVAQVTMNRADGNPEHLCGEVFRPYQFSWANSLTTVDPARRIDRAGRFFPRDERAWTQAKLIAQMAVDGHLPDVVGPATHYHATRVSPSWANSFAVVATVGDHVFYR